MVLEGNDDYKFAAANLAECLRACTDNRVCMSLVKSLLSFCHDSAVNQPISIVISMCDGTKLF